MRLIICLVFFAVKLSAQTFYPTDTSFVKGLSEEDKSLGKTFSNVPIDSTLTQFQNYFPRNTNGNIGLPSTPLFFQYDTRPLGFYLYQAPYQKDVFNSNQVIYYQTKGPYASLTGIAGSKQEQVFKFLFSNTFKNKLNLTLAFNRYGGNGFYKRQQSFTNNFYTSTNYVSRNNRFGISAYLLFNKLKHQENGGVKNDSLILADIMVNKQLLPINLSNARREYRELKANTSAWYRLNKQDSASTILHSLNYAVNYTGFYTKYIDEGIPSDHYYKATYLDTVSTRDSTHLMQVSNQLSYSLKFLPINTSFFVGIKNEYSRMFQFNYSNFINNSVFASILVQQKKYVGAVKAEYIYNGSNTSDYQVSFINELNFSKGLNSAITLRAKFNYENRHPDYIFNQWFGNHYQWQNNFSNSQKAQSIVSVLMPKYKFESGVVLQQLQNLLYFNEQALPTQTSQDIQTLRFYVKKNSLLFNHLGINAEYDFQHSSYQAITSLPNHYVNGSLFYQGNLFKKALQLQIGFQASYYSAFYGMAYMPATNVFYTQTQKESGDYTFVDFFINARIKPVRFFVKIDHLNQGFMGNRYYLTPNYWQNDRALRFGLNWLFFD